MENATKALLIAATVLIIIILVSLGIMLLKNSTKTDEQVAEVSNLISSNADAAIRNVQKCFITAEEFNNMSEYFNSDKKYAQKLINFVGIDKNTQIRKQVEIIGYLYTDITKNCDINLNTNNTESQLNNLVKNGRIKQMSNSLSNQERVESYYNTFCKIKNIEKSDESYKSFLSDWKDKTISAYIRYCYGYDEDGYLNKFYYIAYMNFPMTWYNN